MSEKSTRHEETRNRGDASTKQPPPEPIYDLTADDKTELVRAATPRERNEEP